MRRISRNIARLPWRSNPLQNRRLLTGVKIFILSLDSLHSMHIYTSDFLHEKSATAGSASKSKTISILKREV
jgi:hypothetical protein